MFSNCYAKAGIDESLQNEFSREYAKQAELGLDSNQTAQKTFDEIAKRIGEDGQFNAYMKLKDMQGIGNLTKATEGAYSKNKNLSLNILPNAGATLKSDSLYQKYRGIKAYSGIRINNITNALSGKMFNLKQSAKNSYDFMRASYAIINNEPVPEGISKELIDAAKDNLELNKENHRRLIKAGGKLNELQSRITGQKWSATKLLDLYKLDDPKIKGYHNQLNSSRNVFVRLFEKHANPNDYKDDLGNILSDEQRIKLFEESFHTIYSEATNKIDESTQKTGTKTYERGNKQRQLHINSADGWIEINSLIGSKKLHELIADNHDFMSKQIALLEWGGPNYRRNAEIVVNKNDMAATERSTTEITANQKNKEVKEGQDALDMLDWWAGINRQNISFKSQSAKAWAGLTNLQLVKLGSAVVSSIGDLGQMGITLSAYEKSGMLAFESFVKNSFFNLPNIKQRKLMLNQAGLIAQTFEDSVWNDARDLSEKGWTRLVGEGTLKASGLAKLDEYKKTIVRTIFMNGLGNKIKNYEFQDIKGDDATIFKSYGINEKDWAVLKKAKLGHSEFSDHMLSIDGINDIPDAELTKLGFSNPSETKRNLIEKVLGAAYLESNSVGVITPTERQRYFTNSIVNRDGSLKGEIFSSMMMFKSFPIATLYNNLQRATTLGKAGGLGYAAKYIGFGLMAGALTVQMKQLIAGRDPRNMNDKSFWGESAMAFGGLGIITDILVNAHQSKVGRLPGYVAGPTIDALGSAVELMGMPLWNAAAEKERPDATKDLFADAVKYISDYNPLSKLWYTKTLFDRLLINDLQEWKSPGYGRRMMSRSLKNYNQRMYWEPGEATPNRAPDLSKAIQ